MRLSSLAFLAVLFSASAASANDPVRHALTPAADDCAKWLNGRKQTTICIGSISGPQTYPTSAGPGLRNALVALLADRGIEVKGRAAVAL